MQSGHVAVLLCTHNGARFIEQQLRSLANQTLPGWSLHVSDDASTDDTLDRIRAFAATHPELHVTFRAGPRALAQVETSQLDRRHPATLNFLTLVSDRRIDADYFAYCDQDDVWHPDKLERAVAWLSSIDPRRPALYCSRTRLMDEGGVQTGLSPLFARAPGFRNALVQSIAGGNTMVLNRTARDLIAAAGCTDVVAHDWWTYLLVSGAGGFVNYDARPTIDYRQHTANLVGSNQDVRAILNRLRMVYAGGFKIWMDCNLGALERCKDMLATPNRHLVEQLRTARGSALRTRLTTIPRLKLYRQTRRGQLALYLAAFLAKL